MQLRLLFAAVALLAASSAAPAQVVINQSSQLNFAGVVQLNGGGPTSATIVQTGTTNGAGILQFGASNSAAITQSGVMNNVASVGQVEILNAGVIPQFTLVFQSP